MGGPSVRFWAGIVSLFTFNLALTLVLWLVAATMVFRLDATTVRTGSMAPQVEPGDVVLLRSGGDGRGLDRDAVIRFGAGDAATLHRILDVREDGTYVTKGDANEQVDQFVVGPSDVDGVGVLLVPFIGTWLNARAQAPALVIPATILVAVLLLVAAAQALDPANDPWLSAPYVPRRLAARVTTAVAREPVAHLLPSDRLARLRAKAAAGAGASSPPAVLTDALGLPRPGGGHGAT